MVRRGLMFARRYPAATALTALGLVLGVVCTWNMTATFDSVRYANVGHWIAHGEGISSSLISVPVQDGTRTNEDGLSAFTIQPPGLPIFYALTGSGHWQVSHRLLHVLCFGVLALLVRQLALALLGRELAATVVVLAVLFSPVFMALAGHYWTDLPFTVFLLGSLWAVIRASAAQRQWWRWLLLASALAGMATGLRLPGLALGLVFLADGIRGAVRRGLRHGLLRLLLLGSVVVPVAAMYFLRNLRLAGSLRGVTPQVLVETMEPSLTRAWIFVSSRIFEAFVPGFATREAARRVEAVGEAPGQWTGVGIALLVLFLVLGVVLLLRRRGWLGWPARGAGSQAVAGWYAALLVLGSLAVLVLPVSKHPEIHVVELRFLAPVLPLLWVPVAAVLCGSGRRVPDLALGAVVVAAFVVGAFFPAEPAPGDRDSLRTGLDWVAQNLPAGSVILTNSGKELVEENLSFHVYNLSTWHYRSMLPEEMRSDRGLRQWAQERGVTHLVLTGRANERRLLFWGDIITHLIQGLHWPDHLMYRDGRLRVYRVPRPGERTRSGKGGAGR